MVYIVQQSADGRSSTIHAPTAPSPTAAPASRSEREKHTNAGISSTQPQEFTQSAQQQSQSGVWPGNAATNSASQPEAEEPISKNPIITNRMFSCCFGRSLCGVIVLGLAAGIISKKPVTPLLGASIANIIVGALHLLLISPCLIPRKPLYYKLILAASTVLWTAAMAVMFAMLSNKEEYVVLSFDDRKRSLVTGLGLGIVSALENITIACGCFGASALILCLIEWWDIAKAKKTPS